MNDSDLDYQAYLSERQSTVEAEHSGAATYDKWLITLASGAFGLSIIFFKDIAQGKPRDGTAVLIVGSWALLLASICCTMASFLTSQAAFVRYREILDARQVNENEDAIDETNLWSTVVLILNIASLISFILGALLLALFCIQNVKD
ncbi:hypothetical protein [Rhodopirellula sp. MGV]|uniref:hypothetical protein n=1 Tax=Rhodopirellula sp. MGV TaxID=2023130 RepID=UPI000B978322|nr:hypothetical protein [Rhodopirellula sp. MGV]OYP33878.1 hypothetical protein CGZ80_16935 [Rhodopirellula sp. MGV]PNY37299.1 hypothetical protein C2E31_08435 [Rhodopirellula baltica]